MSGKGLDVRDVRPCQSCGKQLLSPGLIQAYRVTVDTLVVNQNALRTFAGLSMMLGGNESLAAAMAPDTEMLMCAVSSTYLVCFDCYARRSLATIDESVSAPEGS